MLVLSFSLIFATFSQADAATRTLAPGKYSADFGYAYRDKVNMISWSFKTSPRATLRFELQRTINGKRKTVAHRTDVVDTSAPLGQFISFTQEYNGPIRGNTPYRIYVTNKTSFSTTVEGWPN